MSRRAPVIPIHIGQDQPIRLALAAEIAFPDGSMSVSGLRKERDAGRLVVERIAGKDYTTLSSIEEMRAKCRVNARVPASGSGQSAAMNPAPSSLARSGSSSTEAGKLAQDALRAKLNVLRNSSPPTSLPSTNRSAPSAR